MTALIQAQELSVGYVRKSILPPVSFQVGEGEVWGIIGPNGSGKSTLLKSLLGILPPVSGKITRAPGLTIGYVPQRTRLDLAVPARVIDVVRGGVDRDWSFVNLLHIRRHSEAVERAMRDTHVLPLANQQFATLSEGQKQRVMIARALASNPSLLVLDEPTSAMDAGAERKMFELLGELRASRKIAVLLVSHHLPVLGEFATHAVYVDRDEQFIEPGDINHVCECSHCVSRYGHVLHRHDHG
ncbi:MAG: metal ABC transporter ATP-binding protein [bacterium]